MLRLLLLALAASAACGDDGSADAAVDSAVGPDADAALCVPDGPPPDSMGCTEEPGDYAPGNGAYESCVSDLGRYVPIEPTISTVGRIRAFEEIAALLFDPGRDPSSDDFQNARRIYQEDEGLDSRMVRRYDPHFEVPAGTDCTMVGVPMAFEDYCVGPAQLQPMALDALNAGIAGIEPRTNAGTLEGALLWFLYVSTYKESLTCTSKAKDCDSAVAYYTGGMEARCGVGLSRYVHESDPYAHDRAWDGALALRCWRELDPEEVATDLALRDRARGQYDSATLHGVASVVRRRLREAEASAGAADSSYHWASARVLSRALDRHMSERSPEEASSLREQIAHESAAEADIGRAIAAIDAVFACP